MSHAIKPVATLTLKEQTRPTDPQARVIVPSVHWEGLLRSVACSLLALPEWDLWRTSVVKCNPMCKCFCTKVSTFVHSGVRFYQFCKALILYLNF